MILAGYPFALCILLHDVVPVEIPMIVASVPPVEYVAPDGQQALAIRFRDLCAQTTRRAAVYAYSLVLQARSVTFRTSDNEFHSTMNKMDVVPFPVFSFAAVLHSDRNGAKAGFGGNKRAAVYAYPLTPHARPPQRYAMR